LKVQKRQRVGILVGKDSVFEVCKLNVIAVIDFDDFGTAIKIKDVK
jgi:hypothetical protein